MSAMAYQLLILFESVFSGGVYEGDRVDDDPYGTSLGQSVVHRVPEEFSTIQEAINVSTIGDIVEVGPGTYTGPIQFNGWNVVVRSTAPNDPQVVAQTVLQAGPNERAVVFHGLETADSALLGFTIKGDGSTNSGGIGGNGTKARIMYNVFINNDKTANQYHVGGAINDADGLIEGNRFGVTGKPNKADRGGALRYCGGTVRKNWFEVNHADDAGGAIADSNGVIVQNFFYKNDAAGYGGALAVCNGSILSNVFYDNSCGTGSGGAINNCDAMRIEQNTIYGNRKTGGSGSAGGIADSAVTGEFRNNILWANTTPNGGTVQIANSPGLTYSDVQYGFAGTGNINLDPFFVSTSFVPPTVFDDTFSGGGLGSWVNVAPSTWTDNGSYLGHVKSGTITNQVYVGALLEETRHIWFSYMRESDSDPGKAAQVHFRWKNWPDTVRLKILPTSIELSQTNDNVTTPLGTANVSSDPNVWYKVTIISDGPYVQVWRAAPGNEPVLLMQDGVDQLEMARFYFQVDPNGHFRFDDVSWRAPANLDVFLKLKGIPDDAQNPNNHLLNSPCLDRTDLDDHTFFNDFDDHMGPINAPDPLLQGETPGEEIRDMGALEWRAASDAVYWWENF